MKVLGFDSWLGGGHNFERLVRPFAEMGVELSLLHLGAWGDDRGRPKEERIGSLLVRDISFYEGLSFDHILDDVAPDAVLFLSTHTFAHSAFLRLCNHRNIPTVHLYHGLVRVQQVDDTKPAYKANFFSYLRFGAERFSKAAAHSLPAYAEALLKTSAPPSAWWGFLRDFVQRATGGFNPRAAEGVRATRCCVYTGADIQHAVSAYGFRPEEVIPVGNPDLITFGLTDDAIGSALTTEPPDGAPVMFIDTALVASGLLFRNDAEYIEHIAELRDRLSDQGRPLLYKPHPDTRLRGVADRLAARGIEIIDNANFVRRLRGCSASIVETTTLAMIPALLGMPQFHARFGTFRSLQFGEVLRTYPRAHDLADPAQFSDMLDADCRNRRVDAARAWIDANAGPLPSADMPKRVGQVLLNLSS